MSICKGPWNSQEKRTSKSEVLNGERVIREAGTLDQRREIILVGGVAPHCSRMPRELVRHLVFRWIETYYNRRRWVNQLFLQRCEKAFHARIIKAAMGAAHALSAGTELGVYRPVFLTGVLTAVVGMLCFSDITPDYISSFRVCDMLIFVYTLLGKKIPPLQANLCRQRREKENLRYANFIPVC